jgi:ATP-binding cassette subfamily B protein
MSQAGSPAASSLPLPPGSEHPWPAGGGAFALREGELVLIAVLREPTGAVLERRSLACLQAPCRLPAAPPLPARVELRWKVVHPVRWEPLGEPAPPEAALPDAPLPDLAERLVLLAAPSGAPGLVALPAAPEALLFPLAARLAARHDTVATALLDPPADPLEQLRTLLERAGLIALPLQIAAADLRRDCGDLILLDASGPRLLLSEADGYHLWDPAAPTASPRRLRRRDLPAGQGPWPALGVSPSLPVGAASPAALLRFSTGPARQQAAVLVTATTLGLAIGFLLAIGKEVGAARWIAGLGGVGALLGVGLALLSQPLRPALITALLSTLLGLLVPTFNTLLTNQALPEKDGPLILQMGALLLVAAFADVGLRWSEASTLLTVQQRGGHRLQLAALHRLLQLPAAFFQRYRAGELSLRFGSIDAVQREIQAILSGGALQALLSAVFLLFMLRISAVLTALAVVLALVLVAPTVWIGRRNLRLERRQEERLAEAGSRNLELIHSVAKLRLAGVEAAAARHWWEPYGAAIRSGFTIQSRNALASLLQTVVPNLGVLLLFILITRLVADAALMPAQRAPNVGQLLGFFSAFTTFLGAVGSSASLMVQAFELPVLLERARPILAAVPESADPGRQDPGRLRGGVAFEGVRFRYGDQGPWVIDDLRLRLQPGEYVAVVGPSGSGKSTLVRLLLGLEEPQQGEILLDGRPLKRLRLDAVRRQIGVVPQNAALLAGTLREVISGGAAVSTEAVWQAAAQAAIAAEIQAMPMGLHTLVSEGGGNLSGGQRQRLAIARALVRQPALLILDEATSALDNLSQAEVSRQLRPLGLTRLVIAHRLSTIRHADRIVVLEAGRLVEEGSFEELIARGGAFAQLMRRQWNAEGAP